MLKIIIVVLLLCVASLQLIPVQANAQTTVAGKLLSYQESDEGVKPASWYYVKN